MSHTLAGFDFHLPPKLIAQDPAPQRSGSRLMLVDRASQTWSHHAFGELPDLLHPGDFLVLNDTRVFPARLQGAKATGGRVELLLHHLPEPDGQGMARARASCRGRLKMGQVLHFGPDLKGEITGLFGSGVVEVQFRSARGDVVQVVLAKGEVPLPPYIRRAPQAQDHERYQTVYASHPGAVAAPTAGLHFTQDIMAILKNRGIDSASLTLHVGPGTFQPVRTDDYTQHQMQPEYFIMPASAAAHLNQARAVGKHLVAVGTTSARVLEHCASPGGFAPRQGWCDLFIYPGYHFKAVDHLLTNFHLPRSTLLLLVAAFAGRDFILAAYQDAIKHHYRFYSYGDCMLIV